MKKMILAGILSVFAILAYGQNSIQMKGVEGINQKVLDKIIADYTVKTMLRTDIFEYPLETNKHSIVHRDFDSGNFIHGSTGRAYFQKKDISTNYISNTPPFLTPHSIDPESGFTYMNVKELVPPANYNAHTKKVAIFFDSNQNLICIEGFNPEETFVWDDNANKKFITVILLCKSV